MKNLLVILFLSLSLFSSARVTAQSIELVKWELSAFKGMAGPSGICYAPEYLAAISDTMFSQGNPKYIWVDMLKDGYIKDGDGITLNLYINTELKYDTDRMDIPAETGETYANKWNRFINLLKEPPCQTGEYSQTAYGGVNASDVVNPNSAFRKTDKSELSRLGLTSKGELRFLKELVKDGLAPIDKAINLEFSKTGFYVHGQRLSREQREKYMDICKEEFGHNYYNDGSSMARGALPENILSKEIDELTARIKAVENNSDNK